MRTIARCGIYEERPEVCRAYPTSGHYTPPECTFSFDADGQRHGECACDVGACCNMPRAGGEPGGKPLPEEVGGRPCKYLTWVDVEEEPQLEKIASQLNVHPLLRVIQG